MRSPTRLTPALPSARRYPARGTHAAPRWLARGALLALLLALLPVVAPPLRAAAATTATFAVTSTTDAHDAHPGDGVCASAAGACTVRAAIEEANVQPTGSAITITLPTGGYKLPLGQLEITRNSVVISGTEVSHTQLVGQGSRVLQVDADATVLLRRLTLTEGNAGTSAPGASAVPSTQATSAAQPVPAVSRLLGTFLLGTSGPRPGPDLPVARHTGTGHAGSACARHRPTGLHSRRPTGIQRQRPTAMDQAVAQPEVAGSGEGGGLYNEGTVTLGGVAVSCNVARDGGGLYNAPSGHLTLRLSTVDRNSASGSDGEAGSGGGILNNGVMTLSNLYIISNTATSNNSVFTIGGGIANGGTATLSQTTVSGNTANRGGGIDNGGSMTLRSLYLSTNTASFVGGGIFNSGTVTLSQSTVSGNRAVRDFGGGHCERLRSHRHCQPHHSKRQPRSGLRRRPLQWWRHRDTNQQHPQQQQRRLRRRHR